ncbi:hypothetical protein ABZ769_11240 [Streptomyces olivoreticuli]
MGMHPPGRDSGHRYGPRAVRARGGNPLLRTSDRVQQRIGRLLVVMVLAAVPAAATGTGLACYRSQMRTVHAGAGRYAVDAHLIRDADSGAPGHSGLSRVKAPVRWTDPGGRARTATVRVDSGSRTNGAVRIWVGRGAAVTTTEPRTAVEATTTAWLAALVAAVGTLAATRAAWSGFVRLVDRRRYAQWAAEWAETEPRMSGRCQD